MPNYWAKFENINKDIFRFDTRIYLNSIDKPTDDDICIGAIVGKNPGSAKPRDVGKGILPINLDNDKLLPTVRSIVCKSYKSAGVQLPKRGYIQVLNLFYLCNPDLRQAISSISKNTNAKYCLSEKRAFPWVWYVWGGESESLNAFKLRFAAINTNNHLYYDKSIRRVVNKPASTSAFAKHTQGLKHDLIVPYISKLIKNG